jgi:hypothetical protein
MDHPSVDELIRRAELRLEQYVIAKELASADSAWDWPWSIGECLPRDACLLAILQRVHEPPKRATYPGEQGGDRRPMHRACPPVNMPYEATLSCVMDLASAIPPVCSKHQGQEAAPMRRATRNGATSYLQSCLAERSRHPANKGTCDRFQVVAYDKGRVMRME